MIVTALTIAGTDPTGGAGIQADLKTFTTSGVYGMSVITAVVAQNTTGVYKIEDMPVSMVEAQLDAVFTDIPPDAVKIGMVSNSEIIQAIAKKLVEYQARRIVVDPVMISTSGGKLLSDSALKALREELMPLADLITPNIYEAELLTGLTIKSKDDMIEACNSIAKFYNKGILIKGGHLSDSSDDLLSLSGEKMWFAGAHIDTRDTHGTGCTLSSAIASNLAKGMPMQQAVLEAKRYITTLLENGEHLGHGNGPLNHSYFTNHR